MFLGLPKEVLKIVTKMRPRYLVCSIFFTVLISHEVLSAAKKRKPGGLTDKKKLDLKDGKFDKLSDQDWKKTRPDDIDKIPKDKLKGAGREAVKNLSKIAVKGGKEVVEKLAEKLNCSQLADFLNATSKSDCAVLKGLSGAIKKCRGKHTKENMFDLGVLVRCGLVKNISKEEFRKAGKEGKFRDASKKDREEFARESEKKLGNATKWGKKDLDVVKDVLEEIPSKVLKKVPKDVLKETLKDGGGKGGLKLKKQKKSDLFRHLFKGQKNLTRENITWICEAGFESQLRLKDLKDLPKDFLKGKSKCFGSDKAHPSVRKSFTKKLCSGQTHFTNETAKVCVYALGDMKPSDMKNETIARLLLKKYLELPKNKRPKVEGEICRRLAAAFIRKYGRNDTVKAGALVKCMSLKSVKDIVKSKPVLREMAKSKDKGLKRDIVKEMLKNKVEFGKSLLQFIGEMKISEVRGLPNTTFDLGDDDENEDVNLEEDESKGDCKKDDDDADDDDDDNNDDDNDDDDDSKDEICEKEKKFIIMRGIGKISELTLRKIIKIVKLLIHGGFTEKDIEDLNPEEFSTIVAILTKRENAFSCRQAKKAVKRYRMLYRNISDALDDMEGMIAFLNETELDSMLPHRCDDVIRKLRGSGFLWKCLQAKTRTNRTKFIIKKCNADLTKISGDELVNNGHLLTWLDQSEFDKIPGKLFLDNLDELRDKLEEQKDKKGFEDSIKIITDKIVGELGGAANLDSDDIANLGVGRRGLKKDDVKVLKKEPLDELQLNVDELDSEIAKQVFKSRESVRSRRRRRRRNTDYSTKDADYFLNLGQSILGLPAGEISQITDSVFKDIVGQVSQVTGWEKEQLTEWAKKAVTVWGAANTFGTDQLLLLNNFAKGFSASELKSMNFSSDDVISSFGQVTGYTDEQAEEIFAKIKMSKAVSAMTGADLLRLGTIAHGMTPDDIKAITQEAFEVAVSQLGKMTGWTNEQLVELKNEAKVAYGETNTWDGGVLSTVNVIIGGFTDDEVKNLESDDLQYISKEAIAALPPSKFKLLSADLIRELDGEQAQSVTDAQISELSEEQKNALDSAKSGAGGNNTIGGTTAKPGTSKPSIPDTGSGSTEIVFGFISLLLPFLASQIFT
ncbi:uncharacterized protein LOC114523070 isoform X2 [Dendronephthya gigantea]|uniref:uncharacterized protein LOC114523070 isoform X2 n=1 Tax=Dendronephthya gigantea TaxID=151771 RepID=UPI00106BF8E9|nr:uncharacterized protein LOC114523070 isoform X2 [Dendronephthya gigantea]